MLLEAASPFSSLLVELVDKKVFFTHPHHFLWPLTWAWGWQYHGINRYGWTYFHTFRSCCIDKFYRKGTRTLKGYLDPDQRSFSRWQTYIICHRKKDPQLLWCQTFKDSYRGGLCNCHFYSVWYCLFNCAKSLLFVNVYFFSSRVWMGRPEEVVSITEAMRAFRLTRWFHGLQGGPCGMKKLWAQPVCLIPCLLDQFS